MPNSQPRPLPRPLSRYLTISSQAGNKLLTAVKKIRKSVLEFLKKKKRERKRAKYIQQEKQKTHPTYFHKLISQDE